MSVSNSVSEMFSVKEWGDLETGGTGRSRTSEMAPFDRPYTTLVRHCIYSSIWYRFWNLTLKNIVTLKSGLEVTEGHSNWNHPKAPVLFPFHSNYGRIFNRLWDIQHRRIAWPWKLVRGCSRSSKMAPFDRPHTTFYWSAIVNLALSYTVLSYLTLNNIVTLKSGLEVTQGHAIWYHSKAWL